MFEWQKKLDYMNMRKSSSFDSSSSMHDGDAKPKKKDEKRYYIYSHIKHVNGTIDDDDDVMNHSSDKSDERTTSRKIRSSASKISDYDRKQVSKNISMVLENLLMSYENSQLPTHGQGLIGFFFVSQRYLVFPHT